MYRKFLVYEKSQAKLRPQSESNRRSQWSQYTINANALPQTTMSMFVFLLCYLSNNPEDAGNRFEFYPELGQNLTCDFHVSKYMIYQPVIV